MAPQPYFDSGDVQGGSFAMPRVTRVVRALLWSNGALWLLAFIAGPFPPGVPWSSRGIAHKLFDIFSLSPSQWLAWAPFEPVWQLVTYGFLHSPRDPFHVLFNMLGLFMFGSWLEVAIGARRFLFAYLASIALGGVAQLVYSFAFGDRVVAIGAQDETWIVGTVGASGAVLFLIVATAVLRPNMPVVFVIFPMRMRTLALIFVGLDVFSVVAALKGGGGNTAFMCHLAGAALGFAAAKFGWLWLDPVEIWARRREVARREGERDDAARLDRILAQIHARGLGSLSRSDKAFLKRMSSRKAP
jgi:membrane associated rhomboid family serine protease